MKHFAKKAAIALALLAWVAFGFYAVQFGLVWLIDILATLWASLSLPAISVDATVFSTVVSGIVYVAALAFVVLIPMKFLRQSTTKAEMGLTKKWPNLRDIGLAPPVLFGTMILGVIGMYAAQALFPGFDMLQEQAIPFDSSAQHSYLQLVLIFTTLVIFAPVAEELLFRGYLYGKLRNAKLSAFSTIILTSLLFAALHLGFGPLEELQWNVFINTFTLALGMGILRECTGSVWAGIIVHMLKNFIAFAMLFVVSGWFSGLL